MASLLITNDFPPKTGGIQTYLGELWSRLGPTTPIVVAPSNPGFEAHDATFPAEIIRLPQRVLLPTPALLRQMRTLIAERSPTAVFIDPIMPLGLLGPKLGVPYFLLGHGAEISGYATLQPAKGAMLRVLRGASGAIVSGQYPKSILEGLADIPVLSIPPGVDSKRFRPLSPEERRAARSHFGIPEHAMVVLGLSRLVPRKGFDVLIRSVLQLPDVHLVIAGIGRDRSRLERLASGINERVQFLGKISEEDLPSLYGAADVFSMLCRDRWKGVEAEGFGIVFLEAAACGVPAIAGRSGGSSEAVLDGVTGYVTDPQSISEVVAALTSLTRNTEQRERFGLAARDRAVQEFAYDDLVAPLARIAMGDLRPLSP